ncbi:MAG TPA: YihY/virulence factor BrkB family protein [Ferruginibacter sp.]|jgi:membrane protein|nr:YihY/virulence factor BrkB family protein [Ferruginibacter sp.]
MTKLERIIVTKGPIAFLLKKSKNWRLPGFEGVPLYDVINFFYRQMKTVGLTERASAIAYNFIMAIPPSFLFLFTLLPKLPFIKTKEIQKQITFLVKDIVPANGYNQNIINFINDTFFKTPKFGILSTGIILALFFASNAVMGLMRSFNKDYIGFEKRRGFNKRWMAIKLTALLFGLVLACMLLLITQRAVLVWVGIQNVSVRNIIVYGRWIFIVALVYFSIAFIYKYAPAVQKRWNLISPGTILATALSLFASYVFTAFVNNFGRYNFLYGSISTVIVIMALIYINSLVLLIGFELNVSIKSLKSIAEHRAAEEKAAKSKQ